MDRIAKLVEALPEGLHDPGFSVLLRRIDESPLLEGNRIEVFFRGPETFEAMFAAIEAAREDILVESYIFKDDATGRTLLGALTRAVARGVRVRVLADAFGSVATRREFWKEMRAGGIEVRLFNPLFPHVFLQPFRDHRKILVVDCAVGFTGGMNIGDEYGSSRFAREGGPWRDTHVRVQGPAAWGMAIVFTEAWQAAGGSPVELSPLVPEQGGAPILILDSRPFRGTGEVASVVAAISAGSRRRLWITTAYFAPRWRAVRVLAEAVRRGVDVRLLLPGRSDVPVVRHAGHGYYSALLAHGIRVFEYQAAVLHAKSVVADDFLCLVGSTNLDFRSFHFNAECNLVVLHEPTGAAFSAAFEADLEKSIEITPALWRKRRLRERVGDRLARMLGPVL